MLKKAYIEITNICNLSCDFCPGTRREKRTMTAEEFAVLAEKLRPHAAYFYLHVMGEPLLHPQLEEILALCADVGAKACITTNGTLLGRRGDTLLAAKGMHKVSVSLHSMEGNGVMELRTYLENVWAFAEKAAAQGIICALRLWNIGGGEQRNEEILAFLEEKLDVHPLQCGEPRRGSWKLKEKLYLEQAERFEWPDLSAPESDATFCYGLRDQIAVLCDGTVVPCCLDHEGDIALGNLFTQELDEILSGERAKAMYDGFSNRKPTEELCRRCGYARRFN